MAKDNSVAKGSVTLSVGSMGVFNYALYENKVSPVRQIKLYNHTDHRDLILKRREELIASGKVVDYVFVEDVPFSSPSAAAGAILGGDSNELVCWQNESGVLLKQLLYRRKWIRG